MRSLQLSLVSNSGLLLASIPETADDTKQILASSLISAIITFAKEVHRQELQSISYHDRNISFVQVHNFVFIIETLIANLVFSERQLGQILEQIKLSSSSLLEDRDPDTITEGEASLILEHCLHDIYNLPLFFTKNPLLSAEPYFFKINHQESSYDVEEIVGTGPVVSNISELISKHNLNEKFKDTVEGFIILLPEQKFSIFVVIDSNGSNTEVGVLKFPRELDYSIFRLFPLLKERMQNVSGKEFKYDILEILDVLQKFEDPGNRFSKVEVEDLSLAFLSKAISKSLENVVFAAVIGEPILIIGNKHTVELVIDTLSVFTQHTYVYTEDWIDTEDKYQTRKKHTNHSIIGMPLQLFSILEGKGEIGNEFTIVDLETGFVKKGKPSYYFMNVFDKNVGFDITKASVVIFHELRKLVSMSYIITSYTLYEKEKAQQLIKDLSLQSLYPQSFIRKAIELARKRNKILDFII